MLANQIADLFRISLLLLGGIGLIKILTDTPSKYRAAKRRIRK